MNTEEAKSKKEGLRQKAYEAELNRLKKSSQKLRKLTTAAFTVAAVLVILLVLMWVYQTKPEKVIETNTVTIHDSIYVSADTVFIQSIIQKAEIVDFYTVQIGAYRKQTMPKSLNEAHNFPLIQYQYNNLNCFAFGKFESVTEARKAREFMKTLGFNAAVIIKMENNQRQSIIR